MLVDKCTAIGKVLARGKNATAKSCQLKKGVHCFGLKATLPTAYAFRCLFISHSRD